MGYGDHPCDSRSVYVEGETHNARCLLIVRTQPKPRDIAIFRNIPLAKMVDGRVIRIDGKV